MRRGDWDDDRPRRRRRYDDDTPGVSACGVLGWVVLGLGLLCVLAGFAADTVLHATYATAVACWLGIAGRMFQAAGRP